MTVSSVSGASSTALTSSKSAFSALGQGDFLKLMTEQLKMQDPFAPTDNKEMLAQMAQFTSLSGISDMGSTLKAIEAKLDALLTPQTTSGAAQSATSTPQTTA